MRGVSRFLTSQTALLALYLAAYLWLDDRVPEAGGLGWDGRLYGAFAQDFFGELLRSGVSDYSANRLLPSFIVWSAAKVAGFSLVDAASIVTAFHIYNGALLIGASLVWMRISSSLRLQPEVAVIGFTSLFVNWAVLKQYGYCAVQTDTTALFLGTVAAWAMIERRWILLSMTALVGSFAWKVVFPLCALLVLFPKPAIQTGEGRWLPWSAAAAAVVLVAGIVLTGHQLAFGAAQVSIALLPVSVAVLGAYVYYVARAFPAASLLRSLRLNTLGRPLAAFAAAWLASAVALAMFRRNFGGPPDPLDIYTLLAGFLATAVAKPGVFLLAHLAFFGPAILLVLLILPSVVKAATAHSAGAALFLAATLAMMLNSESRFITFAYPVLVTILCLALRELTVQWAMVAGYVVASLLLSKVYLPLGFLGFPPVERLEDLQTFPHQWMFMNIGPWMGWGGYFVNLAWLTISVGAGLVVYWARAARRLPGC